MAQQTSCTHKDNSQCCTVSFAAAWRWYQGLVRQSPQRVSKARRRTFEAEDLFAHLVQIVDAGRRYSLCLGTRANGAHPSFESCLPQRWPTLRQILQIFGEQSTAQPGPIQLYRVQVGRPRGDLQKVNIVHSRSVIKSSRKETRLLTLPCAKSCFIQMPSQDNKLHPKSSSKTRRSS